MRQPVNVLFVAAFWASVCSASHAQSATDADREQPFRENAQAFVDAYAQRDADAIGQLFTADAEFVDEFGDRTVTRAEIVRMFADVFETAGWASVDEIVIDRVKYLTDHVALEEGTTVTSNGDESNQSRYVALHVRNKEGVWQISTVKSFGREASARSRQLSRLAWLVGEWSSEQSDALVRNSCRWTEDGNYLIRDFSIRRAGETVMQGRQRIGWDPVRRQLRSWTFDTEGGMFEGSWVQNDREWTVTTTGVTSDGETANAVAVYRVIDAEMIRWQYRSLLIGNVLKEDSEEVTMMRRPPAPGFKSR